MSHAREAVPPCPTAVVGPPGPVLVVIGPSAGGKSTLVRALAQRGDIVVHSTWTTRPPRSDELGGVVEHRFVDEAAFEALAAQGFFWKTAIAFGLPHRYGLPPVRLSTDGRLDTVMLRAPFVEDFRRGLPAAVVYQIEPRAGEARDRLVRRGAPPAEVEGRLADNERAVVAGRALADRTFVNDGTVGRLVADVLGALAVDRPTLVNAVGVGTR